MAGLMSMHKKMQEWFMESKCCDISIELMVLSDEPETEEVEKALAAGVEDGEPSSEALKEKVLIPKKVAEIKAHVIVLGARSDYISACMTSGFEESISKKIRITLSDEQEVEDFCLLIKLSYTISYTKDADNELDSATLIRLAALADQYAFHDAVIECLTAAGDRLTFKEAMTCINDLPEHMRGIKAAGGLAAHVNDLPEADESMKAAAGLPDKAFKVLIKGLEDPSLITDIEDEEAKEKLLKKGADALAGYLGPVVGFFAAAGDGCVEERNFFGTSFHLKDGVKALSTAALARLLQSDALQVDCEEETYLFMTSWILQTFVTSAGRQQALEELLPSIRFEHFVPDYLINVISYCPLMLESNKLSKVMAQAFLHRRIPEAVREAYKDIPVLSLNRGQDKKRREWKLVVNASLDACIDMGKEGEKLIPCGIVMGYPVVFCIQRCPGLKVRDTCGMYWQVAMPSDSSTDDDDQQQQTRRGVGLRISWKPKGVEDLERSLENLLGQEWWGFKDVFDKPWEEVVYAGSPYFPRGKMTIEATVTDLVYWHEQQVEEEKKMEGKTQ